MSTGDERETTAPHAAGDIAGAVARAILVGSSDAVVAADREGVITFWNPGAERILGYPAAEATGATLDLIIPERLREAHWRGYHRMMRTGHSRHGAGSVLSVPGVRRGGERVSLEFTLTPLQDPAGRTVGTAAVLRDVTARFEETKALRRTVAALGHEDPGGR